MYPCKYVDSRHCDAEPCGRCDILIQLKYFCLIHNSELKYVMTKVTDVKDLRFISEHASQIVRCEFFHSNIDGKMNSKAWLTWSKLGLRGGHT